MKINYCSTGTLHLATIVSSRNIIMNKVKKVLYVTVGIIALALGSIGVILPILPTTPFLLLASFCFVKGSDKFDRWFKETKLYKKHLEGFVTKKAMTLKQKICILGFADAMIAIPFILTDSMHVRIMLVAVILFKLYYFTFRIKTIKATENTREISA